MLSWRRQSLVRATLLVVILLAPGLLPMANANAARQAEHFQSLSLGDRASSTQRAQAEGAEPLGTVDTRIAKATGSAALQLLWETRETTVGVPTSLTIQAVDADGQPDANVSGALQLDIEDLYAQVYQATVNPVAVTPLAAEQLSGRQRFTFRMAGGQATLAVLFQTAGSQVALATLVEDVERAGQSDWIQVRDVFFRIEGPTARERGETGQYVVKVVDELGETVVDYAGELGISASDPLAEIDAGQGQEVRDGEHSRDFGPQERGEIALDVAFSRAGEQTLSVSDGTPWRQATLMLDIEPGDAPGERGASQLLGSGPSFNVTASTSTTNAGVPLTLTVTALDSMGATDTGYTGTVKFSSTDSTFAPGTTYQYTFTGGDAGVHVFNATFNTAGSTQTITVYDKITTSMTGTSPSVNVGETYLVATFGASTVAQDTAVNLTVEAQDSVGSTVTGYRGTVGLASSWDGVLYYQWGTGVTGFNPPKYTFTSGDAGIHTFTPKFKYAGDQTATITDQAKSSRTVTTSTITVTNKAATWYPHESAPSGVKLADESIVEAFLGIRGRLYVRRNVGTLSDPAWRPLVTVREPSGGTIGADTPSLVRFGSTLALFHTYTDGTYFQIWLTTSTDDGDTWSTPTQLTTDSGHAQRIQAVVDGSTLYLFWSRQDTNRTVTYRTTSDLSSWSSTQTVGQQIGVPVGNTTSNFGITKLSSGSWVLGWLWTSTNNEFGAANNLGYPTVHTATSSDLSSWSNETELHLPYSQRWPKSVALAQDPDDSLVYALFEQFKSPYDTYVVKRTSSNAISWNTQVTVGYDRSVTANGYQGFKGSTPGVFAGSLTCLFSYETGGGTAQGSGHGSWENGDSGKGNFQCDADDGEYPDMPYGPLFPEPDCWTNDCNTAGYPINTLTGYQRTSATDFMIPTLGLPLDASRTYRSWYGVYSFDSQFGFGWNWTYGTHAVERFDGSVTIIEGNGRMANFWWNGADWDPAPNVYDTLDSDGSGGYLLTRHDQVVWAFDSDGVLTSITDRNGNETTLSYDGSGFIESVDAPGGRSLDITTDANGRITRIDVPGSLYTTYTYDGSGKLLTATDAAGDTTTYTYSGRREMLTVVDANSHTVETNTYGSLGRVVEQDNADGQTMTFDPAQQTYAGSLWPSEMIDYRGNMLWYTNDAGLRLTQRMLFEGLSIDVREYWTYDERGNVLTYKDGNAKVTAFTYDARDNLLTVTENDGIGGLNLETIYTYNSANDVLTVTDPLSHTTTLTYDANGNLTSVENHLSEETTFDYDAYGQLIELIDPESRTFTYDYSTAGDLVEIVVPGSATTTLGYDSIGRLTSVEDANSHTTTAAYNGRGQITSITNALSQATSYTYDDVGNLTVVTDALTRTTDYDYDELNRLILVTDALDGETAYAYDENGNLTSLTDANDHATSYTYDALNRAITMTDPLSEVWEYSYDDNHNMTLVEQPNGKDVRYVYDAVNRLTGIDLLNNSSLDIEFAYDDAGRRTSMEDDTGTTDYTWDAVNRLTSVDAPTTGTVSYGYNDAGQRTSITYPSTHQVAYAYNSRGELATVTDWLSGVTTYSYDTAGRLTDVEYPNGVTGEFDYDNADRLTDIEYLDGMTSLEAISYVVNAAGVRTSMTDGSGTTDYTYDLLYRLTEVEYPNSDTTEYGYDAVGNRTSLTINGGTPISNTYNDANALTASGSDSYSYDDNGNLISKTIGSVTTDYTWDAFNRLLELDDSTTEATYDYNGDWLRVAKTVDSVTTDYTWDPVGLGDVIADEDEYVRGLDLISQITSGNVPTYVHQDGLGSVRLVTDSNATVVGTETFDAFGVSRAQTGTQLAFSFAGEQLDSESGLAYLRARYLDPETGRFISRDPIGFAGGDINLYAYVANNPVIYVDPSGHGLDKPGGPTSSPNNLPSKSKASSSSSTNSTSQSPAKWPKTPAEMDEFLGFPGKRIPDGPNSPGRGKVEWQPAKGVKITGEQHPYDRQGNPVGPAIRASAPGHFEFHWHLDYPGTRHLRFMPGDLIPGFCAAP